MNQSFSMPKSFYKAETRSGYYVEALMKEVWAKELELLAELDRVCKKYNLTYFADYGTLLGAVRHGGFVPWDDDMDITMYRDDYSKLCQVAKDEFKPPFSFQNTYNCLAITGFSKLRNAETTAIEEEHLHWPIEMNQGIFIDINPLDDAPDGTAEVEFEYNMKQILWNILGDPEGVLAMVQSGEIQGITPEFVMNFMNLSKTDMFNVFEKYCEGHDKKSEYLNYIVSQMYWGGGKKKREWYESIEYLPFENIKIPCPAGYDEILRVQYGDYMKPVQNASTHSFYILNPQVSYREYVKAGLSNFT